MSFELTGNNLIIVKDENINLTNLVVEINRLLPGRASARGRDIQVDCDLQLEDNVHLFDSKKNFDFLGEYFFIKNKSIVSFGEKLGYANSTNNFSTWSGCSVIMPNIKLFGSAAEDAGKFFAYDSDVDIFCEWKFLGVNSGIEIIRTNLQGYGQYNGGASIMNRVRYRRTSAMHGILKPIGKSGQYYKVDVRGSVVLDNENNYESNSITVNSETGDLDWEYGEIDNYTNLIHMLSGSNYSGTINLLGTIIKNGYKIDNPSGDKFTLHHKFKFSGTLHNTDGLILPNTRMIISNKKNEVEHDILTDNKGNFDLWISHYRNLSGANTDGEYLTPHTVKIEDAKPIKLPITKNIENVPLFITEVETQPDSQTSEKIIELIEGIKVSMKSNNQNNVSAIENINNSIADLHELTGDSFNITFNALKDKINISDLDGNKTVTHTNGAKITI